MAAVREIKNVAHLDNIVLPFPAYIMVRVWAGLVSLHRLRSSDAQFSWVTSGPGPARGPALAGGVEGEEGHGGGRTRGRLR